jgi:hypothetical protein
MSLADLYVLRESPVRRWAGMPNVFVFSSPFGDLRSDFYAPGGKGLKQVLDVEDSLDTDPMDEQDLHKIQGRLGPDLRIVDGLWYSATDHDSGAHLDIYEHGCVLELRLTPRAVMRRRFVDGKGRERPFEVVPFETEARPPDDGPD